MALPSELTQLSDPQFGAVARCQLVTKEGSITDDQVHGWLKRGALEPLFHGVYRVAGSGRSRQQEAMAALLRARPGAVLTGPFVLGLLDVDGFSVEDAYEVLTVPGRSLSNVAFPHRPDPHPDRTTAAFGPLRIVLPTDALIDTGTALHATDERRLRVGLDSARWRKLTNPTKVLARARELGDDHPGARFFRELLADGLDRSETDGERRLGTVLQRFDPPPEPQIWVSPDRRSDWYWRLLRLTVEYQGEVDHGFAARRAADLVRDDELAAIGIASLPVTAHDLRDTEAAARWIEAVVVRRAFELGVAAPRLVS
jgi:hypothetical protein